VPLATLTAAELPRIFDPLASKVPPLTVTLVEESAKALESLPPETVVVPV
jgi:hypothetical protein